MPRGGKNTKALSKNPVRKLSREQAQLEKAKKEVLERGARHKKPIMLAKRRVVRLTLSILAAVVVLFLVVVGLLIYVSKNDGTVVYRVSQIIPFPAARVNGDFVSYADYLFEVRYRKNIYANPTGPAGASQEPVDFSTQEGQDLLKDLQTSAMQRAKAKAIIKQMADSRDIGVSDEELDKAMDELVERQGGRDKFISAIEQFYGWNADDFKDEYRLQLLQQKLQLAVLPEHSTEQRAQADKLLARARGGEDFAKLAKEFSQDTGSAEKGGDLGFVGQDTPYVEEFKQAALVLKKGELSGVVASQFGFHIIKATDTKDGQVKVSHILIEFGTDMEKVLQSELEKAKTTNFIAVEKPQEQPVEAQVE